MGFLDSFKTTLWNILKFIGTKLLAPLLAVLVIMGALVLVAIGAKDLQIGGLLGKLLGKSDLSGKTVEVTNTIDPNRIDANGKVILPGQPDSQGDTQAVVVPINPPGVFSDPNVVTFTPPGETKPVEVKLPDGVTSKDVDQIIVVNPEVLAVTVKDSSGIPTTKIDDLLSKYGA